MAFKFENLKVWQRALDLSYDISQLTKMFPESERYILTSQIMRATDSIALNIAEGSTGQTDKEFKRFLSFSIRSGIEVVACLHLAKRRNLINEDVFIRHYNQVEGLIISIQSLRKNIKVQEP